MRINNECARKILIEVENLPYGETITVAKLQEKMSEFTIEEMLNTITTLNHEHFLSIIDKAYYDDNDVLRDHKIKCLNERGYRALDLIRSEELWDDLKKKIDNFNELSIFTILDIANKIQNVKYNKIFDLPSELLINNLQR